jgi:hypothetical protein
MVVAPFLRNNPSAVMFFQRFIVAVQGRIQDFKLGGHLKKLRRAEGGEKIVGVFRVKNHDFTPKNHIFSNFFFGGTGARACLSLFYF